jgi:hypothetical protein
MKRLRIVLLFCMAFLTLAVADANTTKKESPWLLTPLVSSDPKLKTSLGAMGGYIYKFDETSPASMFFAMGTYSSSKSYIGGLFARTYFDEDKQRLLAGVGGGKVHNEYNDFLGTGQQVNTTDNIYAGFTRYSHRVFEDWFIGAQLLLANYTITGNDWLSGKLLEFVGLDGFKSNGAGVVMERDTRDNQNSPSSGSSFLVHNTAYRKALGGKENFDVYQLQFRQYFNHMQKHVLAVRLDGKWTDGAPPGAYATVNMRGYTAGQYLAPYATTIEAEERLAIIGRWGASLFAGATCLYGEGRSIDEKETWFPAGGGGVTYMLKEEEKMVVRADIAVGKNDNYGFYLQFGRAF